MKNQSFINFHSSMVILLAVAMSVFLTGCPAQLDEESGVQASGNISNTTGNPVRGAVVTFYDDSEDLGSAVTDTEGMYEINLPAGGSYTVEVVKSGYDLYESSQSVSSGGSVDDILMEGGASIQGVVIDSQTGDGLADATVAFSEGTSLQSADTSLVDISTTTNSFGEYSIEGAPSGNFVCVISGDDFITRVVEEIEFEEGTNDLPQATLVDQLETGQIRIVLSWGSDPQDLDTHLTGPVEGGTGRFHLYYVDESPSGSNSFLDVDDTNGFGPETTTIETLTSGLYRYSVHNYDNQSEGGAQEIFNSPTTVEVFDDSGLIATYRAPSASSSAGNVWRVFEMNVSGSSVSLSEIGRYDFVIDEDNADDFRISGTKKSVFNPKDF